VKARLLTITLAVVLGLVGIVAVLAYVRQADERAVAGLKAETVMMAEGAIPAGTSLSQARSENLLGSEEVPVSSLNTPAVQSVTTANEHMVVSGTVPKGQVLLQNMLASAASVATNGSLSVPPGMVAVTVLMCVQEEVAGYVTAGSDVAVFDTYDNLKTGQTQRTCEVQHTAISPDLISTRIVLARAKVLAVGQSPAPTGTSAGSASTLTDPTSSALQDSVLVTLALSQADAERLISIAQLGMPYMALLTPASKTSFDNPANPTNLFQP